MFIAECVNCLDDIEFDSNVEPLKNRHDLNARKLEKTKPFYHMQMLITSGKKKYPQVHYLMHFCFGSQLDHCIQSLKLYGTN